MHRPTCWLTFRPRYRPLCQPSVGDMSMICQQSISWLSTNSWQSPKRYMVQLLILSKPSEQGTDCIILCSCQIRDGSCGSDIFFKSGSLFRWSIYTHWFIRRWISLQVKSELNTSTAGNLLDLTCHYFIFVIINNVKMESIRKLSNFNFQWTKTLHQNNLNHIAFFFTFFKDYRYNQGCQKVLK